MTQLVQWSIVLATNEPKRNAPLKLEQPHNGNKSTKHKRLAATATTITEQHLS
jgi:hypothetical protein